MHRQKATEDLLYLLRYETVTVSSAAPRTHRDYLWSDIQDLLYYMWKTMSETPRLKSEGGGGTVAFRSPPHNLWLQTATVVGGLAAECSHTAFSLTESHGAHREGFLDGTIITLRTNEASTWKQIPLMGTRWLCWCIFQQLRSSSDDYLNCFLIMVLRIRALRGSTVCSLHTEGNQFLYNDYILCCLFLGQIHLFTLFQQVRWGGRYHSHVCALKVSFVQYGQN